MKKKGSKTIWKKPSTYLMLLSIIISTVFIVQLFVTAVLPSVYQIAVIAGIAVLNLAAAFMTWKKNAKQVVRYMAQIIAVLLVVILFIGNVVLYFIGSLFHEVTELKPQKEGVSVVVLKDSAIQEIDDLTQEDVIGIYSTLYREATDKALEQMEETLSFVPSTTEYQAITEPVEMLYQKEIAAMVMNEACRDLIKDQYEKFDEETRVIHTYQYETDAKNVSKKIDVSNDSFTVLITGIDTYGNISTTSRSDVNILATVNPVTHQILLTSIPRDYYVPLVSGVKQTGMDGQKDKLTHTGLFGADCTAKTLEGLFGIDINYYVKVNFSSVVNIVDAIGGITVNSEVAFGNFVVGENQMNGEQALAFSRERYSFESGDRQRGKNQMKVIEAIVAKVMQPDFSNDYMSLIQTVKSSVEMNFSSEEIESLIRMQLADMRGWTITSISVDGTGADDYSCVYGSNLYVMYPDESTVQAAKSQMEAIANAE